MLYFCKELMKKYFYILFFMIFSIGMANAHLPMENIDLTNVAVVDSKEKVVLYPNPATTTSEIKVISDKTRIIEVSVYSLLGNKLFEKAYSGDDQTIQLNVQNYKKGKYLVKIIFSDGTSEVKALIKQ